MPKSKLEKLTPYTDGKKRKMTMTSLTAVALTAHGANPEANVTFFKSVKKPTEVEKGGDLVDILTSVEAGHQHGIRIETYDSQLYLDVAYAKSEGEDCGHYHVLSPDGLGGFEVSFNAGHNHTIDGAGIRDALFAQLNKGIGDNTITEEKAATLHAIKIDGDQVHMEDIMPLKELQKKLDASQASLAKATSLATLNDAQKSHYAGLVAADQDNFLGKTNAEREAILVAIKAADPVEFTAVDGTEYHKSAGPQLIAMAKQLDLQAGQMVKSDALAKHGILVKRAAEELGNIAGEEVAKIALLSAIDTIIVPETLTAVKALLTAANSVGKIAVTTFGSQTPAPVTKAEEQLEAMVAKYCTDNACNTTVGYSKVLETAAGQALYNESVSA